MTFNVGMADGEKSSMAKDEVEATMLRLLSLIPLLPSLLEGYEVVEEAMVSTGWGMK